MTQAISADSGPTSSNRNFVAINYTWCKKEYRPRLEELFGTRAHAIDRMPGFIDVHVLRPRTDDGDYLIVSFWETEQAFKTWTQ